MKRLDYVLEEKLVKIINLGLNRLIRPDIELSDVTALNKNTIRWLKQRYGIEGVVIDVDETIRKGDEKLPECNREWLETLRGELKVVILSNGWSGELEKYFEEKGIDYIKLAFKPAKRGFRKACESMGLDPSKVIMIGNDTLADIHGGKRSGLKTARVVSVKEDDER